MLNDTEERLHPEQAHRDQMSHRMQSDDQSAPTERHGLPHFIGISPSIHHIRQLIQHIAPTDVNILINGQTGTGKEVTARYIHAMSRRTGPFVAINCGALPESLFESELFGHEAGAFTSAQKRRIGKLEYAQHGTVFLDEIESMPLSAQVKLLRVLQERQLERLGGNQLITMQCRFIIASKKDLLALSQQSLFREDLYYRISVISIDLPPLSERREDIPLLFDYFIDQAVKRYQRPPPHWTTEQMIQWQAALWSGNVRELNNFAERLVLGMQAEKQSDLSYSRTLAEPTLPEKMLVFEKSLIKEALTACNGKVAEAAVKLGIPKKTLYDKLKKQGFSKPQYLST